MQLRRRDMSQATEIPIPIPSPPTPARISVRAVLAGAAFALALDVLLTAVGAAFGVSAMSPTAAWSAGLGAGIIAWLVIALALSVFFGAWVATAVARARGRREGVLHGLTTWAVTILLGLWIVGGTLGAAMGGMFGAVTRTPREDESTVRARPLVYAASARRPVADEADPAVAELAAVKQAIALGLWSLSLLLVVPLAGALGGGVLGAKRERRVDGRVAGARRADDRRADDRRGDDAPAPAAGPSPSPLPVV